MSLLIPLQAIRGCRAAECRVVAIFETPFIVIPSQNLPIFFSAQCHNSDGSHDKLAPRIFAAGVLRRRLITHEIAVD
jgi:hypothetical protein